jgi:hypothetical protein
VQTNLDTCINDKKIPFVTSTLIIKEKLFASIVTKITFYEIKFIVGLLLEKMEDPPTHHLNSFLPPLILLFISNYRTTAGLHLFISHPFRFLLPVADKNFAFAV